MRKGPALKKKKRKKRTATKKLSRHVTKFVFPHAFSQTHPKSTLNRMGYNRKKKTHGCMCIFKVQ